MEQYDLYMELQDKRRDLNTCIRELRKTGTALAEAERRYKVKLREYALRLKDEGMAIGLINLTIHGVDEVADLRFERDRAEVVYNANKDAVNAIKLEMRIIENQIAREYATPQAGY